MLFKSKEHKQVTRKEIFGGKGEMKGTYAIPKGEGQKGSHFKMIGRLTLNPGVSLGLHTHEADEEIYMILSGHGLYTDNDGKQYEVGPGDVSLTMRGQQHALEATGSEPIVMMAVIVE